MLRHHTMWALAEFQSVHSALGTNCCILFFFFLFRIMSPVKNNVGRGLNIALVNGELPIHPPPAPAPTTL